MSARPGPEGRGRASAEGSPRKARGTGSGAQPAGSGARSAEAVLGVYRPDVARVLATGGAPAFRYSQVFEHLLRRPLQQFSSATALPGPVREDLDALGVSTLTTIDSRMASDGTVKFLLSAHDGRCIETVVMPYRDRVTVCVSSQIGCPVGCSFCATGAMGFERNLSPAEIVDQVRVATSYAAAAGRRVSNVVYMGMGEPLLNLRAVLDSIQILTDPRGLHLGHRAISVSTVGIPAAMLRLGRAEPQVNLALSLHASDDRTRTLLIPKAHRHPLPAVLNAAWEHFAITHRKLLVEYVLLRGINDSTEHARRLAALLRGHVVAVNLLAWNPSRTRVGGAAAAASAAPPLLDASHRTCTAFPMAFEAPPRSTIVLFRDTLLAAGVEAVIRHSKGAGIQAACGQLAGRDH